MRSLTYYYSGSNYNPEQMELIKDLCRQKGLLFVDQNIDGDPLLEQRFGAKNPVVLVGPYRISPPFTLTEVEVAVNAALERNDREPGIPGRHDRFRMTRSEKFAFWFSKSYVWVISTILFLFLAFSFLPPILMKAGNTNLASGFYGFYRLLCHQLFYRSFFIGGEQIIYPRELAHLQGHLTYEQVVGKQAEDLLFARNFQGNEKLGYKVALCQRDVAIYFALGLSGVFFEITRRRAKPFPWYVWIIFAVIPIGIDGFSQLPGLSQGWPLWLPARESTPFLRIITGMLFGFITGWYVFPLMEESMKEVRFQLGRKKQISLRAESKR